MRKFLLITALAALGFFSNAQTLPGINRHLVMQSEPMVSAQGNSMQAHPQARSQRAAGATRTVLHSHRIGSAGNIYTILEGNCKQVDVNKDLNAISFIHRNDDVLFPTTNIGQYRYDYSLNRGATWRTNVGPITTDPLLLDNFHNGRYPQGFIYNPVGNLIPDSAHFIYSGTWHNQGPSGGAGTWQGDLRGRGPLTGDSTMFNVHIDQLNGGMVAIGTGLTQSTPGVFWNLNEDYTGNFSGGAQLTIGLILEKGTWNPGTRDVTWTALPTIMQNFITYTPTGGTNPTSAATSFSLAFDPSGKYGWVACLGDTAGDNVFQPMLWGSTDSGATWTGPYICNLNSVGGVVKNLGTMTAPNAASPSTPNSATSGIPTTAFEEALTVDVNGTPHILTTIGNEIPLNPYTIDDAGYDIWDITFNPGATNGCMWLGTHLAKTGTLGAIVSNDAAAANQSSQDQRPQISRSADGTKVFCFWVASDVKYVEATQTSEDNLDPNLFGRGIDVNTHKMTPLYNFSIGDTLWGGGTTDSASGAFFGVVYPDAGKVAFDSLGVYNIPMVFSELDYGNTTTPVNIQYGSGLKPAAFWYISNINVPASDFTQNTDSAGPIITLNGLDTVSILVNAHYPEQGASAYDCGQGNVPVTIVGGPDTSTAGLYTEYYIATDSAGNTDTVARTIIVGGIPDARFTWHNGYPTVQFVDQSTNFPTQWQWRFTSPTAQITGSTNQDPLLNVTVKGIWNICLTATNNFGSSPQRCQSLLVTDIEEVAFGQFVSMFPNPTNGKVTIAISETATPEFTVSITDMIGQTVVNPVTFKSGTSHADLDVSNLAGGVYLVKIQSSEGSVVKHLTVTQK